MTFTAIHRAVGASPGPFTNAILDDAVSAGVTEAADLDWKTELPPAKGLPQTDYPKDVAAMANSGGGVIVYGVAESGKAAAARTDTGELTENHERALRSAAITAISPPVFGLEVHRVGHEPPQAVVIEVPASNEGPHLIYKGEYFGAPTRNDADTVWMKEQQIEAAYRARFDERRHAIEALDNLYIEAARGRGLGRAFMVAVAHPRMAQLRTELTRDDARVIFYDVLPLTLSYTEQRGVRPLDSVDRDNPRPGLRRWVAANAAVTERQRWKEAWASIHQDGSATIVAALGGHYCGPTEDGTPTYQQGAHIESAALECAIADFMALVRVTAQAVGNNEYDIRVGIEWDHAEPLRILTLDNQGFVYDQNSTPLLGYTPIERSVSTVGTDDAYATLVYELARDCVNQGGISNLHMIKEPAIGQDRSRR